MLLVGVVGFLWANGAPLYCVALWLALFPLLAFFVRLLKTTIRVSHGARGSKRLVIDTYVARFSTFGGWVAVFVRFASIVAYSLDASAYGARRDDDDERGAGDDDDGGGGDGNDDSSELIGATFRCLGGSSISVQFVGT